MVFQLVVHAIMILWLNKALALAAPQAKPYCNETCGDVGIPYPFGMESAHCYMNEWFAVTCDISFNPPKPFIRRIGLEVLEISLQGTVRVNSPIFSSNCHKGTGQVGVINLTDSPFSFSHGQNNFFAGGCDNLALLRAENQTSIGGCMSICNGNKGNDGGCYGVNCCQTTIPSPLKFFNVSLGSFNSKTDGGKCKYAFLAEDSSDTDATIARREMEYEYPLYLPAVLDWVIDTKTCNVSDYSSISTCGPNAYCSNLTSITPQCYCAPGYQGNPFLQQGCPDKCMDSIDNPFSCGLRCFTSSMGDRRCYMLHNPRKRSRVKVVILGIGTGLGILFLLIGTWWFYKVVKRRRKIMLKKRFFKRNGGLLLQQELSSSESNVEKTKLFTSKELEKATDHYNENRILGQGGQGTVYKGMLTDGKIVAIKRSKMVDDSKLEQFINEVVILSQINHRNVVKLLGCCLETEVPLLVYEYIPNGTLSQYVHDQNEEFPVSWEMHLRIAVEVAGALYYLHSAASMPIYHRDIKSSNILLDEKYRAKVSDFGTSRTIAVDQTHLTTLVHGTFGYLDPEYFQSSQFTEKSDVYSFGVVLVELLTGQKAILSTRSEEGRSLATHFILLMEENRLFDILDARVVKDSGKEEIIAVANLAKRCLNLNGKKRPTMREVAMELEAIKRSQGGFTIEQNHEEEEEYVKAELIGLRDAASTSTGSYLDVSVASPLDIQPLLFTV